MTTLRLVGERVEHPVAGCGGCVVLIAGALVLLLSALLLGAGVMWWAKYLGLSR